MSESPFAAGVQDLADYVSRRAGLSFEGSRRVMLREALVEASEREPGGLEGTLRHVETDGNAFARLCHQVTVQESFFFRERAQLRLLREHLRAESGSPRGHTVRVWSVGCAAGEEAYTLAMVLDDAGLRGRYRVLGTDLSPVAVASATTATFGEWSLRGLDAATVARYFVPDAGRYRVRDEFRTAVELRQHNVLDPLPAPPGTFDVVFCRNLLIYLTDEAVAGAATRLVAALRPGGLLVTGATDPPLGHVDGLETVVTGHGTGYRRLDPTHVTRPATPREAVPTRPDQSAAGPRRTRPDSTDARCRGATPPTLRAGTPDLPALVAEGELALQKARSGSAVTLARRVLDAAPDSRAGHHILVLALAQQRLLGEAVQAAEAAVERFPTDAETHRLLAAVLLDLGRAAEASAAARRAVYLDPGLVPAYLLLSRAEELLGHRSGARRAKRNARQLLAAPMGPS